MITYGVKSGFIIYIIRNNMEFVNLCKNFGVSLKRFIFQFRVVYIDMKSIVGRLLNDLSTNKVLTRAEVYN